jgi:hypothetical protein
MAKYHDILRTTVKEVQLFLIQEQEKLNQIVSQNVLEEAEALMGTDINLALSKFNECLLYSGESMRKTIYVRKEKLRVWFNLECKESRKMLRQQLRKFIKTNVVEDRLSYTQKRREYKELLKKKKKEYKENLLFTLQSNINDPKKFWDTIRSVRPKSVLQSNITKDEWFRHFKNVFNAYVGNTVEEVQDPEMAVPMPTDSLDCRISEDEIRTAIRALKANKAAGPDGLIGEFYKAGVHTIMPFMLKFFNFIFDNGLFRHQWYLAILQPLHKKGDVNLPDNYRGISLLNICSKIYSFVLNKRIGSWIEENNIIGEEQAGFRKEYSTTDHVFTLMATVQKQLVRHRKLYVAFIDFRKAFDSVSRGKLWTILQKNGLNGKILKAVKSMYEIVKAQVRVAGDLTDTFMCPCGLKQGETCSPVLFSLFINELTKDILELGKHGIQLTPEFIQLLILLFADDVALFSDTIVGLQTQLNVMYNTAMRLDLVVNLDKSNVFFRNGGYIASREKWYYGSEPLKIVNSYKYLGIVLTTRLSFSSTLEDLASRARKGVVAIIKTLWSIGEHSPQVFFKMFDCQIQPILTYGAEIWGLSKNLDSIERVHLFALKKLLGVHPSAPKHLIYGETGRYPLCVNAAEKCVKFWLRLLRLDDVRYSKKAYNMLLSLQRQNYNTWACQIRNTLYLHGFGIVWEMQGQIGDVRAFISCFKQRLADCARQNWHASLESHELYSIYSCFKQSFALSSYLLSVNNIILRRTLARFRMGMSRLNGHYLEYKDKRTVDAKKCPFDCNVLETEIHLLLVCPKYDAIRQELIPAKYVRSPSLFKFSLLMSCTSGTVCGKLSLFVYKAMCMREESMHN